MAARAKVLIVDDEPLARSALSRILGGSYDCATASDGEAALKALQERPDTALMITDYKMPGMNGVELIRRAKAEYPQLGAILLTAFGEIELAVQAMKEGADDFLTKPITDFDQLELRVAKAIRVEPAEASGSGEAAAERAAPPAFVGESEPMRRVYRLIRQAARSNATVLVTGASGTGKELVAKALHELSPRAAGPFVAVECAALSASLLESELFGYEKQAFTGADQRSSHAGRFEAASGGTLFLDEIGEIDAATQVKLLRVLESRVIQRVGGNQDIPVDFRLVAATNRNLAEMVVAGDFREDLFYRLDVIEIPMPALKERREDIEPLLKRYLAEFAQANALPVRGFEPAALQRLVAYDWPGNVRQLRNVVERMVVLSSGEKLTEADLPEAIRQGAAAAPAVAPVPAAASVPAAAPATAPVPAAEQSLAEAEKAQILAVLRECGGNKSKAAIKLGISRRTLHRKLNEWKEPQA